MLTTSAPVLVMIRFAAVPSVALWFEMVKFCPVKLRKYMIWPDWPAVIPCNVVAVLPVSLVMEAAQAMPVIDAADATSCDP